VRIVIFEFEVASSEVKERLNLGIEAHRGAFSWCTSQLETRLFKVVLVEVGIAKGVNELPGFEAGDLSHHHGQKGVGGDVEGHPQEHIGAPLVQLAREGSVTHIELKEGVAGWECNLVSFLRVLACHDDSAAGGVVDEGIQDPLDLIHPILLPASVRTLCGPKIAPLVTVNRSEITGLTAKSGGLFSSGPFVPDSNLLLLEWLDSCVSMQKPEKLVNDGTQVQLFRGQEWEALLKIEAHLVSKDPEGSGPRSIRSRLSVGQNVVEQFEVRLHGETRK
jgi:hypothetical protein